MTLTALFAKQKHWVQARDERNKWEYFYKLHLIHWITAKHPNCFFHFQLTILEDGSKTAVAVK